MALTANEAAIADLWDAGHTKYQIAAQLGLRLKSVENILARIGTGNEQMLAERAIRNASRQLGDAVYAYLQRRAGRSADHRSAAA